MNIATLWVILLIICVIGLVVGLINPSTLNDKKSKKQWTRKDVAAAFGTGIVISLILLAIAGGSSNSKTNNSTSGTPETVKQSENAPQPQVQPVHSVGYGLAKLHAGSKGQPEPDEGLVKAFEDNLRVLNEKCTEDSEEKIADIIVTSQKLLKEKKNVSMDLTKVAIGIRGSIPDEATDLVSCAEIAALFVTLTDRP